MRQLGTLAGDRGYLTHSWRRIYLQGHIFFHYRESLMVSDFSEKCLISVNLIYSEKWFISANLFFFLRNFSFLSIWFFLISFPWIWCCRLNVYYFRYLITTDHHRNKEHWPRPRILSFINDEMAVLSTLQSWHLTILIRTARINRLLKKMYPFHLINNKNSISFYVC